MRSIDESLCSISFNLKDLVEAKKFENELTATLR